MGSDEGVALHPGASLRGGRYRMLARLAEGGSGQVWRALDTREGREVAIKAIPLGGGGAEAAEREAEAVARVRHPGVVQVHGTFLEGDVAFIVMELARRDLAAHLELHGPLSGPQARGVAKSLAEVLAAAHAAGVVHRDLKPQNVLVMPDGSVRLGDFGIARLHARGHTRTGALLGTLPFMAPEQRRDARDVRPATDVYAWAALLSWMRTGSAPGDLFAPEALVTLGERLRACGELDPGLLGLIARCGRYAPGERPRDGEALLAELTHWADGEPLAVEGALEVWDPAVASRVRGDEEAVPRGATLPAGAARLSAGTARAWVVALASLSAILVVALAVQGGATPSATSAGEGDVPKVPQRCSDAPSAFTSSMYPRRSSDKGSLREAGGAVFGDADGDGRVDLVVPHQLDEALLVFWGDGTPILGRSPERIPSRRLTTGEPHSVAIGDLTGDGIPDIVAVAVEDRGLIVHPGLGGRTFAPPTFYETGEVPTRVFLADLDTDGDLDVLLLLVGSSERKLSWRENVDGTLSDSLPLVIDVTSAVAAGRHVWVVQGDQIRALRFNRLSRQLDTLSSSSWPLESSEGLQVVSSPEGNVLLGWSARWGVPSPAVRVGLVDGTPGTPCALDLPQGKIQDVADIGDDGHVDVALVETCAYCTSNYMVAVGR